MSLVPITLREANAFIERHHRHHKPARGCVCVVGVSDAITGWHGDVAREVVGVAIVGRPSARLLDADPFTAEVTRVCVRPGLPRVGEHASGACSMLYGAAWRAARALGYRRLVTYTLPEEHGASLRGAGWTLIGEAGGGSWDRKDRPRVDLHPTQVKLRWERAA